MINKLATEGLINKNIYLISQYEMLSYYYGFTPEQVDKFDTETFNWYMSFAIERNEKGCGLK